MSFRKLTSLAGLFAAAVLPMTSAASAELARLVVYYGSEASPDQFPLGSRAVLDGERHPSLAPLKARGVTVFGYVSLGEAETSRSHYRAVAESGVLLGPNPDWPDARYVDLRKPAWQKLLLDEIIPGILAKGFDGLFLDTLDDAGFLEHADPVRYHGMVDAAAALIRAVHARYPNIPLMLNRAYDVGVLVAPDLDSVLAESLASTYDFKTKRYRLHTSADMKWGLGRVAEMRERNPQLSLYSLDYWDLADRKGVRWLYDRERRAGFIPYVATIDLQRVVPEPGADTVSRASSSNR